MPFFGLITRRWKPLFLATVNEELSCASCINTKREQLILTIALGVTVALSIKVIGVLLITAMLIIPAAAARNFTRDPEMMAIKAGLISCTSVFTGLQASYTYDTPPRLKNSLCRPVCISDAKFHKRFAKIKGLIENKFNFTRLSPQIMRQGYPWETAGYYEIN